MVHFKKTTSMNRQLIILIILTNLTLTSCAQNADKIEKAENNQIQQVKTSINHDYSVIKLIDRFNNKLVKDTAFEKTEAQFSPIYIGEKKAEVNLTYKTEKIENRVNEWDKYKRPEANQITITIDTSRIVGSPMGVWEYYKKPEYRNEKMSYPAFIENLSTDTLNIGFGDILPLIIEAKDTEGNWRPIQRPFIYDCGTGLTEFILSPGQIAITTMKIYEGDFKTKLRLVFEYSNMIIFSNEIVGQINSGQFE
jgi:hypothetical protein